jgi:release factor glutamine methyltransferase
LYLRHDQPLTPEELARFKALIVRRRLGEPVAYLTGHKEFWSLDFQVGPGVLIPRPETEILVQAALEAARQFSPSKTTNRKAETGFWAVEIGVGSGAVVVSLAKELPHFYWLALDLSEPALTLARNNARRHGVEDRLNFVRGDLSQSLKPGPRFALLVANLPYVPRREWEELPGEIRDFESRQALLGGEDGLDLIRALAREAHRYLQAGGCLALEVGAGQADLVLQLLEQTGAYLNLKSLADYQGIPRVVRGQRAD